MRGSPLVALAVLLAACSSQEPQAVAPAAPRAWQRLATNTSVLPPIRGLQPFRGIIHSHSPYSHDACDGDGLSTDGVPRADCVADLRQGMCDAAEDFVFLTDHAAHMAEYPLDAMFFFEEGDDLVKSPTGEVIANRIFCNPDHSVLVAAGNEDELMSLGLERHLPGDVMTRQALYDSNDAMTVQAMHDAGALVMIPHTESRQLDYLIQMPFDGMEVYNLHAAIDPDIRKDFLGLDGYAAVAAILPFTQLDAQDPEPDLTFLGLYEDLHRYTELWDTLLPVRQVVGVAGTDVHQNTFPGILRDGERGDSYRRLMRWFSNVVLLDTKPDPASIKDALRKGRSYIAFEILGVPVGFDFHAESGGVVTEIGDTATGSVSLHAQAPSVFDLDPVVKPPTIEMRLYHVLASGTLVVGEGTQIQLDAADPGAYRIEVRITPHHLRSYLGLTPDPYIRSFLWVMSNPIYVQ